MNVQVTTLPNNMKIITDSMPEVATVSLGVWVGVGTRHETPEINGVAHLVEHMLFKGTPTRSAFAISEQIESVGGHMNAYTTREQTAYYARVLKEDTGLAMDILADMLQNSLLDPQELDRERTVIQQEIGQTNDAPDDIIHDHLQAISFPGQTLGMPVLGSPQVIGSLPRESLSAWLQHYAGSRMVLVASGHVHHEQIVEMAARAFARLPRESVQRTDPAVWSGGDFRENRTLEQLHLVFGFQGPGYHDPDYYTVSILSTLLGGGMSSRLFQEVREKRGLVYSIHTFSSAFEDGGLFGIYAGTGPEHAAELIPVVCDELQKVENDLTEAEFERARAQLRAGILMGLESTAARSEHLGQSTLIHGRPVLPEETLAKLAAVTPADVKRAIHRLVRSPLSFAAIGPVS
ncbi:MAG: insulinase family protein, partial [Pseudomonadota bacterium]|nr:insulinase family protein [Pseudomonadota bacterium]